MECSYDSEWRWASTRELTISILDAVKTGKSFSDVIAEYQSWRNKQIIEDTKNPNYNAKDYAMKHIVMPNDIAHIYARYHNAKKLNQNTES